MYKPLPDNVTIRKSEIHGLGLFATKRIAKDDKLGVSHISIPYMELIRTPLGGFINHSTSPNVYRSPVALQDGMKQYHLIAKHDIRKGREITLKYQEYDPTIEEAKAKDN